MRQPFNLLKVSDIKPWGCFGRHQYNKDQKTILPILSAIQPNITHLELDPAGEVVALAHGDVVVVLLLVPVHHLAAPVATAEGAPLKHGIRLD